MNDAMLRAPISLVSGRYRRDISGHPVRNAADSFVLIPLPKQLHSHRHPIDGKERQSDSGKP